MENDKEIKIALWEKTSKSGIKYYGGSTDTHWVSVFKNKDKKSDKSPDLNIVMTPKDINYKKQANTQQQNQPGTQPDYDDIPF